MTFEMDFGDLIGFLRSQMAPKELARRDNLARDQQNAIDAIFERKMQALKEQNDLYLSGGDWRSAMRARIAASLEQEILTADRSSGEPLYSHVQILPIGPGNRCCPACKALDGKAFTFQDAVKNSPLPPEGCTCDGYTGVEKGFCLCLYQPIFDDELPTD